MRREELHGMLNRQFIVITCVAVFTLCIHLVPAEAHAEDVCNVDKLVTGLIGKDGPLSRCNPGDIAHFQIDSNMVAWSNVAARYCDFDRQVLIELQPGGNLVHVVCSYKWKWAKEVTMEKHPDAQ